jgi:leucyl-tRNA synthetase
VLEAQEKMPRLPKENGFGKATVTYRLKDWGVSRQRYWGTPIPMVYCKDCGMSAGAGERAAGDCCRSRSRSRSRVARRWAVPEFVNTTCPKCGGPGAARDRHDGHVRRFELVLLSLHGCEEFHRAVRFREKANYWFPIDQYIGGVEHAILHLIYSRFWTKVMRDLG